MGEDSGDSVTEGGHCGGSAAGRTTSLSQMALQLPPVTVRAGTRSVLSCRAPQLFPSPSDSFTICNTSTLLCLLPCGGLRFLSSTARCPEQLCCGVFFWGYTVSASIVLSHMVLPLQTALWNWSLSASLLQHKDTQLWPKSVHSYHSWFPGQNLLTNCNNHQHSLKLTQAESCCIFSYKMFSPSFLLLWFICQIHLQRWPEARAFLLLSLLPFTVHPFKTSRASAALCDFWNSETQREGECALAVMLLPWSLSPLGQGWRWDEKLKSLEQADHFATGNHQTIEMPVNCKSTHPVLTFSEAMTCLCEAAQ